jgi:hypothetical protein
VLCGEDQEQGFLEQIVPNVLLRLSQKKSPHIGADSKVSSSMRGKGEGMMSSRVGECGVIRWTRKFPEVKRAREKNERFMPIWRESIGKAHHHERTSPLMIFCTEKTTCIGQKRALLAFSSYERCFI